MPEMGTWISRDGEGDGGEEEECHPAHHCRYKVGSLTATASPVANNGYGTTVTFLPVGLPTSALKIFKAHHSSKY